MPWLIVKVAATLDGKIADRHGRSKWITREAARTFVHDTRNRVDCVLVSASTVLADDPELTVRHVAGRGRDPIRAIIDTELRTPIDSKLAKNPDGKTWIFSSQESIQKRGAAFPQTVQLIPIQLNKDDGGLDLHSVMSYLGKQNILSVMCESGGKLAVNLNYVSDEIYWLIAPKIMGDAESIPAFPMQWDSDIAKVFAMPLHDIERLGDDVLIKILL